MSPEDEQDLRNVMPFVLTSKDKEKYLVRYLGRQMADEIPCYVFAVKPKRLEAGQRYFSGEIWVDDHDLMIVKTYGRATGLLKKGHRSAISQVRDLPRTDRREVLVSYLHGRQQLPAFQRQHREDPPNREVSGLQAV